MKKLELYMILLVIAISIIMAVSFVFIVVVYGYPPDDFFEKAKYPDDYRMIYKGVVYHMGIMVSPQSLFATLAIIGILFSMMGYCFVKERVR